MSYDKNTESMVSFILPSITKDELVEYCAISDRNQSQVLRELVKVHIKQNKHQLLEQ